MGQFFPVVQDKAGGVSYGSVIDFEGCGIKVLGPWS
jgi:hypothetical protein